MALVKMDDSQLAEYRECLETVLRQSAEFDVSAQFVRGVTRDLQLCDDEIRRRTPVSQPLWNKLLVRAHVVHDVEPIPADPAPQGGLEPSVRDETEQV
ncbi:hypothetical protein [Williamsia sp.]|uniref:hypothetical protein n=1 Tax=Williamsia sp. TaxID=1872085 RepID=UPI001A223B95|nr:hypothetical protein [Williamsia sp.]MBJ7289936.1 hypothetical protein [Williamsia sp.]